MLIAPAAPVEIVTVDRPTQVSAYGSGVLFSKRDPATGRFKLWYTETGRPPAPLPVADRAVPFDADLGPGAHGHFLAVYSRCATEPRWDPVGENAPPDYSRARGCRLYELDLTTGAERRLPGSGITPAVWKDRVAFARVYARGRVVLYARSGSGAARRLPGGPAGGHVDGIDLYGRRLAFGWSYPGQYEGPASDIRMDDIATGRQRVIDRFHGGGLTTIALAAPAFEGGKLYYARLCQGDESGCPGRTALVRVRYSTGETAQAKIARYDLWQARGGGLTYVLRDADAGWRACYDPEAGQPRETCSLVAASPAYLASDRTSDSR